MHAFLTVQSNVAGPSPSTLFSLLVIAPIFGYLLTSYLAIDLIDWYGISLLIWARWIWELNQTNNKELKGKNQFDLRLTNIAYGYMTVFYVLYSTKIILTSEAVTSNILWLEVTLIITHSLCAFYMLWITSRTSQLILENREPTPSEVISHIINIAIYPMGIWTIHKPIYDRRRASNTQ
ncbi:MAG: hypothetical protein AAF391_01500 [Bacteroidota bacterium]